MALDVRLVNMPFARLESPSLGLAQLKSVAEAECQEAVRIEVEYVNLDFGRAFGVAPYQRISLEEAYLQSGFGDWLFRRIAFPEAPDNTEAYLRRYGRALGPEFIEGLRGQGRFSPHAVEETLRATIIARGLGEADVIGFSSTFAQTVPSLALARLLRERNRDQIIVMGGANCEGVMGATLARVAQNVDLIFSGPALVSFPAVLKQILAGDLPAVARVDGVIPCRASPRFGDCVPPARVTYGADMSIDTLIPVEYDDFLAAVSAVDQRGELELSLPFETSRGCWWGQRAHCTFCGLNGASMAYRAMSSGHARALIMGLIQRYGGLVSRFDCVDNIMAKEYVTEVFTDLRPGPDVSIFYETKGDLQDDEVRRLALSGVNRIQPGIESLLTSTLKLMRKGTTSFQNIKLLKSCATYDVDPSWNILVGFPGETEETFEIYKNILPALAHLPPPAGAFPVRFDRFSPYHSDPSAWDLELSPADYYKYCYHYPSEIYKDLAYYFQNVNIETPYYVPMFDGLAPVVAIVAQWQARWTADPTERPILLLEHSETGAVIRDTRWGGAILTFVSARTAELIRELVDPKDLSWVETHFPDCLPQMRTAQWVFEERGRVLSLVMLPATALAQVQSGARPERLDFEMLNS